MNKILSICILLVMLVSCKKDDTKRTEDPYKKPWSVKNISYTNVDRMCDSHSGGYKLFYLDSLMKSGCNFGGKYIAGIIHSDDPQLLLITSSPANYSSSVLHTDDGGMTWKETNTGMRDFLKLHYVKKDLIYCFTYFPGVKFIAITGIGKSNLTAYGDTLIKGRRYVKDLGTTVTDLDSTVVAVNDSVTFVIKFK